MFLKRPINSTARCDLAEALPLLPDQKIVFPCFNALEKIEALAANSSPGIEIKASSKDSRVLLHYIFVMVSRLSTEINTKDL